MGRTGQMRRVGERGQVGKAVQMRRASERQGGEMGKVGRVGERARTPGRVAASMCAVVALAAGCESNFDPAAHVEGLRVLAIRAEPPEIPVGPPQRVTFRSLVVDTRMRPITTTWTACLLAPVVGQSSTNRACLETEQAPFLVPLSPAPPGAPMGTAGMNEILFETTLPDSAGSDLTNARPDVTGATYMPVRFTISVPDDSIRSVYGVRLTPSGSTQPANRNPRLQALRISFGPEFAGDQPLEPNAPPTLQREQRVRLHPVIDPADAEMYDVVVVPGQTRRATEELRISWFASVGTFSEDATKLERSATEWRPDKFLPAFGTPGVTSPQTVYIWAVLRDERGGADYLQRTLLLE